VIQRIGCDDGQRAEQAGGCGGFGKGNFHELFRAIEDYETKAGINVNTHDDGRDGRDEARAGVDAVDGPASA
jgi:hypothetical protein